MNPKTDIPELVALEELYSSIREAVERLVQGTLVHLLRGPSKSLFLDFSRGQLLRSGRPPLDLLPQFYLKILELLSRRPAMSVARFVLLPRSKPPTASGKPRPPSHALRKELSVLRRRIKELDLPVELERFARGVVARFHPPLLTNVAEARSAACAGQDLRAEGDSAGACRLAERALAADADCLPAARLVVILSAATPELVTPGAVFNAEICLARHMLRNARASQRLLLGPAVPDADVAKALWMAERMSARLRRHWDALGAWPRGGRAGGGNFMGPRAALRDLLCGVLDVKPGPGAKAAYERFARGDFVAEAVRRLLPERARDGATDQLTFEILSKFRASDWVPRPVALGGELQEQFYEFVASCRIDLREILGLARHRTATSSDLPKGKYGRRGRGREDDDGAGDDDPDEE